MLKYTYWSDYMFKYTLDNKRYHTLNYFFKTKFGQKVFKVPLNINSTCPNKINGGCIFCSNNSASNISDNRVDILTQFEKAKNVLEKKWPNSLYIAYFQSGTNTYNNIEKIKKYIDTLLTIPKVVGISIATRPDCLNDEWLKYFYELNKKTFLMIELGLQSSKEETLKFINRGHDVKCFTKAVKDLQKIKIFTVAHIINGLPFEIKEDMINTVKYLNNLKIDAIKIHMLYISKNTKLADIYKKQNIKILKKEEYIDIVCSQLEYINEKVVIERLTGDPIEDELIEPKWLLKKFCVLNDIDKEMVKRNIYQGILTKE